MYPDFLEDKEKFTLPDEYNKLNNFSNVINDSNLFSREYLSCIEYLVSRKSNELAQADSSLNRTEATHVVLFDSLYGQTQVYALLNDIRSTFKFENRCDTIAIKKFKSLAADNVSKTEFARVLDKHIEKQNLLNSPLHPEFANTVLLDTANQEITFGQLMNKCKGKVVYLDIWSSWCGPCVQEMSFSKELKERFKDKPVEFIYLSCEFSDSRNWDKVFNITQTNENQYILKNEFRSRMLEFMEINSVPTYMLFDKEGKLTNYRAPRPSWTPLIDNSLNKLINE
jgi:thiol-disulfide isomerase/thioredoxin